jgi:murein endopeptidase
MVHIRAIRFPSDFRYLRIVRSWSWFVFASLVATSAGAANVRPQLDAPAISTQTRMAEQLEPAPPGRSIASSSFDIDERPNPGWYPPDARGPLPRWIVHESLPRDTIENVALRYGVSAREVRRWNGMSATGRLDSDEPKRLRVRAKRFPPPREQLIHVAEPGENWDSLGRRYGVFDRHLRAWNKEAIGRSVEPGERVTVWIEPMVHESMRVDLSAPRLADAIPPGAHSIGTPQSGLLVAGVQVPAGEGYERRYPNSTWGTTYAVRHLVETLAQFHRTSGYRGTLMLGSMSFRHGGKIGSHISHRSGRDIDIRLPMRVGLPRSAEPTPKNVDWDATWTLILEFAHSGSVQLILLDYGVQRRLYRRAKAAGVSEARLDEILQYPRGSRSNSGMVRHSPGHGGHIHVRYACGPYEPGCGDL